MLLEGEGENDGDLHGMLQRDGCGADRRQLSAATKSSRLSALPLKRGADFVELLNIESVYHVKSGKKTGMCRDLRGHAKYGMP
jgi:hypothetical protein